MNKIYEGLKIQQSITSSTLGKLYRAGLVGYVRDGQMSHYSVNAEELERFQAIVLKYRKDVQKMPIPEGFKQWQGATPRPALQYQY